MGKMWNKTAESFRILPVVICFAFRNECLRTAPGTQFRMTQYLALNSLLTNNSNTTLLFLYWH